MRIQSRGNYAVRSEFSHPNRVSDFQPPADTRGDRNCKSFTPTASTQSNYRDALHAEIFKWESREGEDTLYVHMDSLRWFIILFSFAK